MDCKCTMAQSLVGDGCDICNPELAQEHEDSWEVSDSDEWECESCGNSYITLNKMLRR